MMKKMKMQVRRRTKGVLMKNLIPWLLIWPRFWGKTGEGRSNQRYVRLMGPGSKRWEARLAKPKSKKLEKIKFNISNQLQKLWEMRIVSTKRMMKMKDKCLLEIEQRL